MMNTNAVDQVIAATPVESEQAPTPEQASKEIEQPKPEGEAQPAKAEDEAPFPKKAINALSRRDKQIGKLRAELAAERAERERLMSQPQTQQNQPQKSDGSPKEEDFDNYGDFLRADIEHKVKQAMAQGQPKQQEPQVNIQEQVFIAQREAHVAKQADALLASNPEYQQVLSENADILDNMPAHIERAFLEADNAPLAFIALAKEGKLESLLELSPARAAMEIARAEVRGEAIVKAKAVTNAPAPLASNKGTGGAGKSLDNMSGDDILKAMRG